MKKQTKLVAVLSTASLLAIGASMTSFAATGWTEEDGTWVYYNRDGERATNEWKKSGNSWYYLDDNGDNSDVSLKTINGKKYSFDEEGKMLFGWVAEDNAERIDNTDGDAFK